MYAPTLHDHETASDKSSIYSRIQLHKHMAQSSMISEDPAIERSASQFAHRPTTLFDDEYLQSLPLSKNKHHEDKAEQDPDWADMVRHLQQENQTLLNSLGKCHDSLLRCRKDKAVLEEMLENQKKLTLDQELGEHLDMQTETSWHRSEIERFVEQVEHQQTLANRQRADLLFQKQYLLLANQALKASEQEAVTVLEELGVTKAKENLPAIRKWRACFWVLIAIQRFYLVLDN
ncbi:hypothetical protein DM01DRAFT_1411573 [Hesseltinella vesiculosa]|uniref:Pericentrin/AKAP-450 centrosomal targeting domain-containing protein n=1 Tax=Hesseltinella vesiculosa TaxID=101127 RepID=A0A1X2G3A8_9FUNG|nr:hypothetical protein DM01DRAFT_1411573 [Hesseltinella vesiculosa]